MELHQGPLLGACLFVLTSTLLPVGAVPAADHPPAVAERKPPEQNSDVIRRYGSSAFRMTAGQLAFSPDGRWLAAADNRRVVLFDAETGHAGPTCEVGYGNMTGFAFSPDGNSLAMADARGHSIWDLQKEAVSKRMEGKEKNRLTHARLSVASPDRKWRVYQNFSRELALARWDQLEPVRKIPFDGRFPAIAVGNEGKWVAATGHRSRTVQIWKAPKFDSPAEWKLRSTVRCLAASPDGEILFAAIGDRTVHAWNIEEARETSQFEIDSRSWPNSMAVTPDGELVAVAGGRTVTTYEADTGRPIHKVEWVDGVGDVALAFAPDGKTLAICPRNRSVEICDVKAGRPIHQPGPSIENVFAEEDSDRFGSFAEGTVRLWNPTTGEMEESFPLYPWPKDDTTPPGEIFFDGPEQLIIKEPGGEVLYRDLASGRKTFERLGKFSIDAVFSGYNRHGVKVFYLGPSAFCLRLWTAGLSEDRPENRYVFLDVPLAKCLGMELAKDGPVFTAAFADKSLLIWDTTTWKQRHQLELEHMPRGLILGSKGDWLAISHEDFINVWDLKKGKRIHQFETPQAKSHTIALNAKENLLAAAVPERPIRLWNLKTGKETMTLPAPDFPTRSMAFSPNGSRLAVGSEDKSIGVFDLDTKKETHVLTGHTGPVTHVKFHPDGSRLASASQTQEVFVWDPMTGKRISSKDQLWDGVQRLYWVAEGKELMVVRENDIFDRFPADEDNYRSSSAAGNRALYSLDFDYSIETELLAVAYNKGIRILNTNTGRELPFVREDRVNHVEWSGESRVLMAYSEDLFAWDVDEQREIFRIPASELGRRVTCMKKSPHSRFVATGHTSRLIRLWDPQTGKLVRKIESPKLSGIRSLKFSADGRLLFGLASNGYRVIEVESGLIWFQKPNRDPRDTSFAVMDRETLLSAEPAGTARLWSWAPPENDKKRRPPEELWTAMFAHDGPTVYRSMFALANGKDETVDFLARRLPLDSTPRKKIASLIEQLGSKNLDTRRKASEELRRLGDEARPQLEAARKSDDRSPRVRFRIKLLLSALKSKASPELLAVRAVQILEWIDSPKARTLLEKWANKHTDRLGKEAEAALGRLSPTEQ